MDEWSERNGAILAEGKDMVDWATKAGLTARLLGGGAIVHHCDRSFTTNGIRALADIDLVISKGQGRKLSSLLVDRGYVPEARFNALHGQNRLLFHGERCHVDVLIGVFEMCHRIDFAPRMPLDFPTLPITDLLLTKLQIVELNKKDADDALLIFSEHDVAESEGDVINLHYLSKLTANDWGLWRTVTGTLARLEELADPQGDTISRIGETRRALLEAPKSMKWRIRAQVGDRKRWYALPDEVMQ